jgi:hypothetical protein
VSVRDRLRARAGRWLAGHPRMSLRMLSVASAARPDVPIALDYTVEPRARFTKGRPYPELQALLAAQSPRFADRLRQILVHREALSRIPREIGSGLAPAWDNGWQPLLDALLLYTTLVDHRPRVFMEIGSGHSTRFARRAIQDAGLSTRLVSIDPHPRVDVDALCDERIPSKLETADLSVFAALDAGDVLFFDGSHRSFMNSDVTVFFLEVLPALKPGVIVQIHDIFLPVDYPAIGARGFWNEQYLLACYLLGGGRGIEILAPAHFISIQPELASVLSPLVTSPPFAGLPLEGASFWFTRTT